MENLKKADQVALLISYTEQYLEASRVLTNSESFHFFPAFYLAHHAVELALKAHLLLLGAGQKDLKDLNHDLLALAEDFENRAERKKYLYRLSPMHLRTISLEGGQYAKKCFEYPDPNLLPAIPIGVWLTMAETMICEAKTSTKK